MSTCLAYFLTWSTYAHRLHGDAAGSVDLAHNDPNSPMLKPNPGRIESERARLAHEPFVLSPEARDVVHRVIVDHTLRRGWTLHAVNVRTNHVHVVVDCQGTHTPEQVMQQFKMWGTRRLNEAGLATSQTHVWADHGSTRYLNDATGLMSAIEYVLHGQ